MKDIPNFDQFIKAEKINKGWSTDKKYYVETRNQEQLLLRISDVSEYDKKKKEFEIMKKLVMVGVNMSKPISFGICDDGKSVYQLLSWVDGEEAKEVLPSLSGKQQYDFGWEAGQMMLKMQKAENYPPSSEWMKIYGDRVAEYIKNYKNCGQKLYGEEVYLSFLESHLECLANRPMSLLHADFQSDNMVISPDNELYAIDFQGSGVVDPYYALGGVMVTAEVSKQFSLGQLDSYFGGKAPDDFWKLNAYYMAAEIINAFSVAVSLGQEEIDYSQETSKETLEWFDKFNNLVPNWYTEAEIKKEDDKRKFAGK